MPVLENADGAVYSRLHECMYVDEEINTILKFDVSTEINCFKSILNWG